MARIARNDVLRRTEEALRAAYPDRATLLIREIKVRFWSPPGEGATADVPRCRFCGRSEKKVQTLVWRLMCDECLLVCHELSVAIDAGAPRPLPDAVLSDAVRAVRAAGDPRADEVISELEARVLVLDDLTGRGLPPICSHCGVRHDESRMVRGPRVWICTTCVQDGMQALSRDVRLTRNADEGSGRSLGPAGVRARIAEAVRAAGPGSEFQYGPIQAEIERWYWGEEVGGAPVEGRCSLCARTRTDVTALVSCHTEVHEYVMQGYGERVGTFTVRRAPGWKPVGTAWGRVVAVVCDRCVESCGAFLRAARRGTALPTPSRALTACIATLRAARLARSEDVIAALEERAAAVTPAIVGPGADCSLCDRNSDEIFVALERLHFCARCIEQMEEQVHE